MENTHHVGSGTVGSVAALRIGKNSLSLDRRIHEVSTEGLS